MINFNRVATEEIAGMVLQELKIIPKNIINITNNFDISVYCFNRTLKPSWIGLFDKNDTVADGRSMDETACFNTYYKSILLYEWDFDRAIKAFSVVLHEYAHALDYSLGNLFKKDKYLSEIDPVIVNGWKRQKGLDWYANLNPCEYFAQSFMAYFQSGIELYKPKIYYEHTREELIERDPDMFFYLQNLLNAS